MSFAVVQAGHGSHPVIVMPNIAMANPAATKRCRTPPWNTKDTNNMGRSALASSMKPCAEAVSRIIVNAELMPEPLPGPPEIPPPVLNDTTTDLILLIGEVPAITALNEKFTMPPGGTLMGPSKLNTVDALGGVAVSDCVLSPIEAVSVSEASTAGSLTVTVTLLNCSVISASVLV